MSRCKECSSCAINPGRLGRDMLDLDLCDVCYWRVRAERLQAEVNALRRWAKAAKNAYYDAMQCLHYEAREGLPAHKALHPDDWERLKKWLTELKSAREAAEKARAE